MSLLLQRRAGEIVPFSDGNRRQQGPFVVPVGFRLQGLGVRMCSDNPTPGYVSTCVKYCCSVPKTCICLKYAYIYCMCVCICMHVCMYVCMQVGR